MKKHKTILLVDDEADILDFVRYNLVKEGFTVICAESGKECLELVKKHHPDLILLDVMMPKMSGTEVCSKLKKFSHIHAHYSGIVFGKKGEQRHVTTDSGKLRELLRCIKKYGLKEVTIINESHSPVQDTIKSIKIAKKL